MNYPFQLNYRKIANIVQVFIISIECFNLTGFIVCTELKENSNINKCLGDCDETCGEYICRMRIESEVI